VTGPASGQSRVCFDEFAADLRTGELFREGQRVVLPNQSFLALAALLERPGELVTRDELRARLWPDGRVVEFEQGLNAVINRLRDALGDSAGAPKFIETLPRRGYRFIAAAVPGHPVVGPTAATGAVASAEPVAAGPSTPTAPIRLYGLVVLLAILIVMVTLVGNGPPDADAFANPTLQRLTSTVGREIIPSFAPDGRRFVFGWNGGDDGGFDLYIKKLDSQRLLRLTHAPALAISPAWEPAGGRIAFARITADESGIYSIPATGGAERLLTQASFLDESFMQLSWSPDGRSLAYSALNTGSSSYIHVLALDGLSKRVIRHPSGCVDAGIASFSPAGHQLAFVCTSSLAVYSVYVTDISADNPRLLASLQGNARGLTWQADGKGLILANDAGDGSALWLLSLSGRLSRVPGSEEALGPGLARTSTGGMPRTFSAGLPRTPTDAAAFVREQRRFDLWRIDLTLPADEGGAALAAASRSQLVPQYSPDGAHVVFQSDRSGSPEIWMADGNGRNPVQLTAFNGPLTGGPSWCSDGRRIAFDSRASGISRIYIMDIPDGPSHPLATSQSNLSLPVWSQDCQWIFASDGRTTLYRVPAAGGAAEQFSRKRAYRAQVSGDKVIFNVARAAGIDLWERSVAEGEERPLPGMPPLRYSDDWFVARAGIYYTHGGTVSSYDFVSHETKVVRSLTGAPAALGGLGMTVSPDGHWLVYTRSADWQGDIMMITGH
jgi:Tol biopolymer transport system component/DNA-binding winged helix-turn-helix (wHTH) protein